MSQRRGLVSPYPPSRACIHPGAADCTLGISLGIRRRAVSHHSYGGTLVPQRSLTVLMAGDRQTCPASQHQHCRRFGGGRYHLPSTHDMSISTRPAKTVSPYYTRNSRRSQAMGSAHLFLLSSSSSSTPPPPPTSSSSSSSSS